MLRPVIPASIPPVKSWALARRAAARFMPIAGNPVNFGGGPGGASSPAGSGGAKVALPENARKLIQRRSLWPIWLPASGPMLKGLKAVSGCKANWTWFRLEQAWSPLPSFVCFIASSRLLGVTSCPDVAGLVARRIARRSIPAVSDFGAGDPNSSDQIQQRHLDPSARTKVLGRDDSGRVPSVGMTTERD